MSSNNKLLIMGAGGLGRMVMESAVLSGYECKFLDDRVKDKKCCGVDIIGCFADLSKLKNEFSFFICAIGDNSIREKYNKTAHDMGFIVPNILSDSAYVSEFAKVGYGNVFLNNVCVQNGAVVGNGVVVTANSEIHHDSFVDDYSLIYSCSVVRTYAHIGKRVKIGSNVTIANSAIIEDDAIIEDGCVRR